MDIKSAARNLKSRGIKSLRPYKSDRVFTVEEFEQDWGRYDGARAFIGDAYVMAVIDEAATFATEFTPIFDPYNS